MELAFKLSIEACLTILEFFHFNLFGNNIIDMMAIHPAQAFIFLQTRSSNIFGPDIWRSAAIIVVGIDGDLHTFLCTNTEPWCNLRVVGQLADESVGKLAVDPFN